MAFLSGVVEGCARLGERSLHLSRLEAESIAILRKIAVEFRVSRRAEREGSF